MPQEIIFTTLEDQGKSLREYSRSLSPLERLEYLYELNHRAYDLENRKHLSEFHEIRIWTIADNETLEDFLRRRNTESCEQTRS